MDRKLALIGTTIFFLETISCQAAQGAPGLGQKNKSHFYSERYFKRVRKHLKDKNLTQCQTVSAPGYFSSVSVSPQDPKVFNSKSMTILDIYNQNGRVASSIVIDSSKAEMNPFKKQSAPKVYQYSISEDANQLLLCREIEGEGYGSDRNSLELEMWNLKKRIKSNIFPLGGRSCEGKLRVNAKNHRAAHISHGGKINLWDLQSGLKIGLSERLGEANCFMLNQNLDTAYCYTDELQVASYKIESGEEIWKAPRSKDFTPNPLESLALKLLHRIKKPWPNLFFKPYLGPAQFAHFAPKSMEMTLVYRHPNHMRQTTADNYQSHIKRFSAMDGKILAEYQYEEQTDIDLKRLKLMGASGQLVGENVAVTRPGYTTFFVIDPKTKKQHQFGSSCSHSWDLLPNRQAIVTCGFCENGSQVQLIPTAKSI